MKTYNRKIYLVCKSDVAAFLKNFKELDFVIFDGTYVKFENNMSTCYVKEIIYRYKNHNFAYAISSLNSNMYNSLIISCINSRKTIGTCNIEEKQSFLASYIRRYIYDEIKYSNFDEWILEQFIHVLNIDKKYNVGNTKHSIQYNINCDKKFQYCVISPGGSAEYKCWGASHYLKITSYILENYHVNIILSGSKADNEICKFIYEKVKDEQKKRIVNYCGQTTFQQWIDLVGNAILLIGNDSAAVHIAANTDTDFICVKGQWYGAKYLPYNEKRKNKSIIIELQNMKCRKCINPFKSKCNTEIMSKNACKCISGIREDDVIAAIDTLLHSYK